MGRWVVGNGAWQSLGECRERGGVSADLDEGGLVGLGLGSFNGGDQSALVAS